MRLVTENVVPFCFYEYKYYSTIGSHHVNVYYVKIAELPIWDYYMTILS